MDEVQAANTPTSEKECVPVRSPSPPPRSISDSILPDRLLANPLAGRQRAELQELGGKFVVDKGLGTEYEGLFQRAAILAQDPLSFRDPNSEFQTKPGLSAERDALERELAHKWDQPWRLYALVITCSLGAVVQGWDE